MSVENILFDLDGTLIDSSPGIEYSIINAVSAVIPQKNISGIHHLIGPPVRQILKQALEDVANEILLEIENKFRISYDGGGWKKSKVYDGVHETLSQLSQWGVKSFVVTNKPVMPTRNILKYLQLDVYFDDVVALDYKVPPFTSKIEATSHILTQKGLNSGRTLFVGDSKDDAYAAMACGLRFVAVAYGYGRIDKQNGWPKWSIINKFPELLDILEK